MKIELRDQYGDLRTEVEHESANLETLVMFARKKAERLGLRAGFTLRFSGGVPAIGPVIQADEDDDSRRCRPRH